MTLLVLRPLAGAIATAARARAAGHDAVIAPLFHYRGLPWTPPPPDTIDAILLTSAAAVRHGGAALAGHRHLPVQAVGSATAAAAVAAGFTRVMAGDSDARAAIAALAGRGHRSILHPTGLDHVAIVHPEARILRHQVYAADPVTALPPAATEAVARGAVALLHSPRAATVFAGLLPASGHHPADIAIGCFSPAIAAAAGPGWAAIAVAARPTDDALFAAVAMLCDQGEQRMRERP